MEPNFVYCDIQPNGDATVEWLDPETGEVVREEIPGFMQGWA